MLRLFRSIFRGHVGDEANAVKMDGHLEAINALVSKADGHVKTKRTVCKAEWAYEFEIVFKDLESFKGYMGSELKEKQLTPLLEKAVNDCVSDKEGIYLGARVYDEL